MVRRAAIAALLACNVSMLIATSYSYTAKDTTDSFPAVLGPGSPPVHVKGTVEAGPAIYELTLTARFDGVNRVPARGRVSLFALPLDATAVPEGAVPIDSAPINANDNGGPLRLVFDVSQRLRHDRLGAFHLALVMEGDAQLDGSVALSAKGQSSYESPDFWIKLREVQVGPHEALP